MQTGKHDLAVTTMKQALTQQRQDLGDQHPFTFSAMGDLATMIYVRAEAAGLTAVDWPDGEDPVLLLEEAMSGCIKFHGHDHPRTQQVTQLLEHIKLSPQIRQVYFDVASFGHTFKQYNTCTQEQLKGLRVDDKVKVNLFHRNATLGGQERFWTSVPSPHSTCVKFGSVDNIPIARSRYRR